MKKVLRLTNAQRDLQDGMASGKLSYSGVRAMVDSEVSCMG